MAKALDQPPGRMTVDQFLAWLDDGPEGARYELVAGVVVAMAPERVAHARRKAAVWVALQEAIASAGLPCEALPDGMTIKIDEHTAYEPDAVVHCGDRLPDDALLVPEPVIVVEVLSPTTPSARRRRQACRLFPTAERASLSVGPDRAAYGDPSPAWRGRCHRDPGRHGRRARS